MKFICSPLLQKSMQPREAKGEVGFGTVPAKSRQTYESGPCMNRLPPPSAPHPPPRVCLCCVRLHPSQGLPDSEEQF